MGFYLNFTIEQYRIKEEIKEKIINNLPDNELSIVKILSCDNEKITWLEEGKEFRFNGNMFDVVKVKKSAGVTYYYCFNDENESRLFLNLDKLVKDQTDNSQSKTTQKKQEITYYFNEILFSQYLAETPIIYFNYPTSYQSITREVLSPPPRITSLV